MQDFNTIGENLSRAAAAIKLCFWRLFGITAACGLISCVGLISGAQILAFILLLAVLLPAGAGVYYCHLRAIRGQKVGFAELSEAFRKAGFLRFFGGMLWLLLWSVLWSLVPLTMYVLALFSSLFNTGGEVFLWLIVAALSGVSICKALQYCFTPLILLDHPEVSARDALRVSMRYTSGLKGRLFGALVLAAAVEAAITFTLRLLSETVFATNGADISSSPIAFIAAIALTSAFSVYCQLVYAGFYHNADTVFCPYRGFGQPVNPWNTADYRDMHSDIPSEK